MKRKPTDFTQSSNPQKDYPKIMCREVFGINLVEHAGISLYATTIR